MAAPRWRELGGATLTPSSGFQEFAMTQYTSLAAASILALTGATAFAQTSAPTPQGQTQAAPSQSEPDSARGRGFDRRAFEALTDARIAGIQAGLKLNADQQKLWIPVEQAMRDMAA